MNQEQILMLVRTVLQILGGVLVTRGLMTAGDESVLLTSMTTLTGSIVTVAPTIWGVWVRRNAGLKASAGALPNTMVVTTQATAAVSEPSKTAAVADKIANIPEVLNVIAGQASAAMATHPKVMP